MGRTMVWGKSLIRLHGAGGSFRYNMQRPPALGTNYVLKAPEPDEEVEEEALDNDNCRLPDGNDLLKPGVTISGEVLEPMEGKYGGSIMAIASIQDPKMFVGDIELDMSFSNRNNTSLTFERIQLVGTGYFMAGSVMDRRSDHAVAVKVSLDYDFPQSILSGYFGVKAKYPPGPSPMVIIPAVGSGQEWAEGARAINFDTGKWGIKFGSWGAPPGAAFQYDPPPSGLAYNTASLGLIGTMGSNPTTSAIIATMAEEEGIDGEIPDFYLNLSTYFQAGHEVDPLPPLEAVVPNWGELALDIDGQPERNYNIMETGLGIAMGMKFELGLEESVGPLHVDVTAGLGFDASMVKYDNILCDGKPLGFSGGWYAQAQAYAYIDAGLRLDYDLGFDSGTIDIAEISAAMVMQLKFPNPTYFKGHLRARYSVLGGLLSGRANYKMELGEQCDQALEDEDDLPAELKIALYSSSNLDDKPQDFSIFSSFDVATSMQLNEELRYAKYDSDTGDFLGNRKFRGALVKAELIQLDDNDREVKTIPARLTMNQDFYGFNLKPEKMLAENTKHKVRIEFSFEEDHDDDLRWDIVNIKGDDYEEIKELPFRTGFYPTDEIVTDQLAYQAPGYR
ncbi:MAG: hypothetical protein AAGA62_09435, partial [Bacteroidota bacterium]